MTGRIGIEIGARRVRAVRVDGRLRKTLRAVEIPWDGERLDEAMTRVQAELGAARHVAIALDLSLLFVKETGLPALPATGKISVLALEPERYFPVRGEELLVTARDHDGLAFAARERVVASALETVAPLGTVDRLEPAPHAVARALAALGIRAGTVVLRSAPRGTCVLHLDGGSLAAVRWIYDERSAAEAIAARAPGPLYAAGAAPPSGAERLPAPRGLGDEFLAAYGAALGVGAPLGETLVPAEAARRIVARRRWRLATAIGAVVAAAIFALLALDRAAAGVAADLAARADSLATAAEGALALQGTRDALDRQLRAAAALEADRARPLAGLAALGTRLPADAYVRTLRAAGSDWQIDGYARDAARLVPLLEAAPEFEQVRFLTATTTERTGAQVHETFSIAFRLARKP